MCESIFFGWKLQEIDSSKKYGHKQRSQDRKKELHHNQLKLLDYTEQKITGAKTGKYNLNINNNILDEVQNFIENGQNNSRTKIKLKRFLRDGLIVGKQELNWQVEIPADEAIFHTEKNPITPVQFGQLHILHKQIENFEKLLNPSEKYSEVQKQLFLYGQLIFSATVFSGLADQAAWLQLPFTKNKVKNYGEYTWIDLFTDEYPKQVQSQRGLRRWFIDPVTLILLKNLPKLIIKNKDRNSLRNWLYSALQHYLQQLDSVNEKPTKNLLTATQWLDIVDTHFHIVLSPYIARYARSNVKSSAWHADTWLRILKQKRPANNISKNKIQTIFEADNKSFDFDKSKFSMSKAKSEDLFKFIKTAFLRKKGEPEPTFKTVNEKLGQLEPLFKENSILLYCLLVWMRQRFIAKEIKRSTAYQQLTSIGRDLLSNIDEAELFEMDAEEYKNVYEDILDTTPSGKTRVNKASLLNRFHAFLARNLGIVRITINADPDGLLSNPDANYLNEQEYQCIYKFLQKNKNSGPSVHIQLIALILGYRCGLRISEVQNIKFCDIQYSKMKSSIKINAINQPLSYATTLLIRGNRYNKLKSPSAKRQIPLNVFLSSDELNEILQFHQKQLKNLPEDNNKYIKSAYLFSISKNNKKPFDFTLVQKSIHFLMQSITGDDRITFHNLRHSFACNYIQLINKIDQPIKIANHLKDNIDDRPTRKNLYELCTYLGHSNPSVSLEHYIHNMDLVLRQKLWPHSFDHKVTGHGDLNRFIINHNITNCISELTSVSQENQRWHIHKYGEIMNWLPKKLGIKPSIQDENWIDFNQTELSLLEPERPRSLIDLEFEEWCAVFSALRKGDTKDEVIKQYYLNESITKIQIDSIVMLSFIPTRHQNSSLTTVSKKALIPYNYIIKPPRTKNENDIADKIYNRCKKLLNNDKHKSATIIGLRYFYENYRHWNKKTIARYDKSNEESLKSFTQLIKNVMPNEVNISSERNGQNSRQPNIGQISLITNSKQAQDGPAFGLLLAYFYSAIKS